MEPVPADTVHLCTHHYYCVAQFELLRSGFLLFNLSHNRLNMFALLAPVAPFGSVSPPFRFPPLLPHLARSIMGIINSLKRSTLARTLVDWRLSAASWSNPYGPVARLDGPLWFACPRDGFSPFRVTVYIWRVRHRHRHSHRVSVILAPLVAKWVNVP